MEMKTPKDQRFGIFVTGTDTGVGKTYVGVRLVRSLVSLGIRVCPRKPIESGCEWVDDRLVPMDANALIGATGAHVGLESVCRYRLRHPLSPERAARIEGVEVKLADLVSACRVTKDEFLLVEGAGGFYSPLTFDGLNADLAQCLGLEVLLVAADRLGCINHVLLTVAAIQSRGLRLLGIVLNSLQPQADAFMDNAADLRQRLSCPVVCVGFDGGATHNDFEIEQIARLITRSIKR